MINVYIYMGVSKNRGTPKSSILIGFSIINHPFWGTSILGNTHIYNINSKGAPNLLSTSWQMVFCIGSLPQLYVTPSFGVLQL